MPKTLKKTSKQYVKSGVKTIKPKKTLVKISNPYKK
tara:strand:- start:3020 stop:3127 length:108 start_codon:yes stop_codon:yes gene_type:complete